jgi:hypothetical protein
MRREATCDALVNMRYRLWRTRGRWRGHASGGDFYDTKITRLDGGGAQRLKYVINSVRPPWSVQARQDDKVYTSAYSVHVLSTPYFFSFHDLWIFIFWSGLFFRCVSLFYKEYSRKHDPLGRKEKRNKHYIYVFENLRHIDAGIMMALGNMISCLYSSYFSLVWRGDTTENFRNQIHTI